MFCYLLLSYLYSFSLQTCSELIKAGLKLSIESKRKMSGSDTDGTVKRMKREDSDDEYDSSQTQPSKSEVRRPFSDDDSRSILLHILYY